MSFNSFFRAVISIALLTCCLCFDASASEETFERITLNNGDVLVGKIERDNGRTCDSESPRASRHFHDQFQHRESPAVKSSTKPRLQQAINQVHPPTTRKKLPRKNTTKPSPRNSGMPCSTRKRKRVSAAALTEKPFVVLYFSASWCPPCQKFTPDLVKYYRDAGDERDFLKLFSFVGSLK